MPPGQLNLTVANSNLILIPILWVHIFMLATHENVAIWVVAHMNVLVGRQEDGGLSMGGGADYVSDYLLPNEVCSNCMSYVGLLLCKFLLDRLFVTHLNFCPQKRIRGSAERALSSLRTFQLTSLQVCDSQKLFWILIRVVPKG